MPGQISCYLAKLSSDKNDPPAHLHEAARRARLRRGHWHGRLQRRRVRFPFLHAASLLWSSTWSHHLGPGCRPECACGAEDGALAAAAAAADAAAEADSKGPAGHGCAGVCCVSRYGMRAAYRGGSRRRWLTGRVLVVCSYNSAGVWTWNTHSSDWIYQVSPKARVIAPRPRRSPQPADASFRGCAVLRQRTRRRTHAGRALPRLHSTPNGLGARKGLVPVVHRRGFVSSAGESANALD